MRQVRSRADALLRSPSTLDVGAAAALGLLAVLSITGVTHGGHPQGGTAAAVGVLAMTLPVAWRSEAPVAAAAAVAAGAVLNVTLFGPMVRCGAALPAVFLIVYSVGSRTAAPRAAAGLFLCALNVVAQCVSDPELGTSTIALVLAILGCFFALGVLVRARTAAAGTLARRSAQLREQRDETARLMVAVDHAQLSGDLQEALSERIERIGLTALAARSAVQDGRTPAVAALPEIEQEARDVLRQMRDIVGVLDQPAPDDPQPSLQDLPALLARAPTDSTRLTVAGEVRPLAAGLALSGYRIVEHLLSALATVPAARVDVQVRYGVEALELLVTGPAPDDLNLDAVVAAARERAALHNGIVEARTHSGWCRASARLPLVSGHA